MHLTGVYQSSYGAQFRFNEKREIRKKTPAKAGYLPGDPAHQRRGRSIDGILQDIACSFEILVFEIVFQYSC